MLTPAGQLLSVRHDLCLRIPGAASNAVVSLAPCDEQDSRQLWGLAH